jgi:NAD(P)H-hydrate repair Nnr-like enzyme with NAD(P)H-hydrate dehydratase domain
MQRLRRAEGGHKYTHGHALLLSGGCGKGGAARLAARGALRIGAGLVTLAVPPAALQENAARLEAIMLRPVRDPEALAALLADPRLNALCVGPGLGTGEREAAMLAALLDATGPERPAPATPGEEPAPAQEAPQSAPEAPRKLRPVVLDADALTLLARHPELRARLHAACVLTPHEGEFARLLPETFAKWQAPATTGPAYSKVDAAREAAEALGCTVLLKGPDTVIAEPPRNPGTPGRAAINAAVYDRAAPWLATAGSGDVLAGMITGLLARGFAPFDAACTAAWLHVEAARSFGPGLIAEDLPEELPKVFCALGL